MSKSMCPRAHGCMCLCMHEFTYTSVFYRQASSHTPVSETQAAHPPPKFKDRGLWDTQGQGGGEGRDEEETGRGQFVSVFVKEDMSL